NEFGYFWSRWFDRGEQTHWLSAEALAEIDRAGLRRAVAAMLAMWHRPLGFKNNTWFTFHAAWVGEGVPKTVFIACRRGAFFFVQSWLLQRGEGYGDDGRWWSVRPPNYAELVLLEPIAQVAWQAISIERAMDEALDRIDPGRVITLTYPSLCAEPRAAVQRIAVASARLGASPELALDSIPRAFTNTNIDRLSSAEGAALRRAIAEARTSLTEAGGPSRTRSGSLG